MEKLNFDKIKHVLPSKKFVKVFLIGGGVLLVVLIATSYFGSSHSFSRNGSLLRPNETMGEAITQDTNKNTIPDWEETLWGLDPKGDGVANKKIIDEKKIAHGIDLTAEEENLTPTDEFSRSLFATIVTLQQSGSITPEAVTNLAASIGDSVDAKRVAPTVYTLSNMTLVEDTAVNKKAYRDALKNLIAEYSDVNLGSELDIISTGLNGGGASALATLHPMAVAYSQLSKKVVQLPTPRAIAGSALNLANAESQMSATLPQIEKLYDDALTGMVGIDDFIKANKASNDASQKIKVYFGL